MPEAKIRQFQCRHGVFDHDQADETVAAHLKLFGEWAEEEILLMSRFVRDRDVVLDIGADFGIHSVPLSRLVGPEGRVFAFEPREEIFPILQLNIIKNGAYWNTNALKAMVAEAGGARLSGGENLARPVRPGASAFNDVSEENGSPHGAVLATSIDALQLSRCDFIRIGTKSYGAALFHGAAGTLKERRPIVYFSPADARDGKAIVEMLETLGYELLVHRARPFNRNNRNQMRVPSRGNVWLNVMELPRETRAEYMAKLEEDGIELPALEGRKAKVPVPGQLHVNVLALPRGTRPEALTRLAALGIKLPALGGMEELTSDAGVSPIWIMPIAAYQGTRLAAFLNPVSRPVTTTQIFDTKEVATDAPWTSIKIPLAECEIFNSLELEVDLSNISDVEFNIQCLIYSNHEKEKKYWNTILTNKHLTPANAVSNLVAVRVTRASLITGAEVGPEGEGVLEIRARSSGKASIGLRNARLISSSSEE